MTTETNEPPAVPAATARRTYTREETVALVWLLEPDDAAVVLAGGRILAPDEEESIAKGVEHLAKRLPVLQKGGELLNDEAAFVRRQLGKWRQLGGGAQKKIEAAVRKRVPIGQVAGPLGDFVRACEIAVQAPALAPRQPSPPNKGQRKLNELRAAGLLCPNKSCRSPRYEVVKVYPPKKGDTVKRRRLQCKACGVRWNTEEHSVGE